MHPNQFKKEGGRHVFYALYYIVVTLVYSKRPFPHFEFGKEQCSVRENSSRLIRSSQILADQFK